MVEPIILDAVLAAVLALAFFMGSRRGIIKMVWHLAAWLITLVLSLTLSAPFGDFIEGTDYAYAMRVQIEQSVEDKLRIDNAVDFGKYSTAVAAEYSGIPKALVPEEIPGVEVDFSGATRQTAAEIADKVAEYTVHVMSKAAGFIILMLLVRIALSILYRILNLASRLPLINGANRLLGGIMGVAGAIFAVSLALAWVAVFLGGDWGLLMGRTYLVKYFYNNNILLQLMQ